MISIIMKCKFIVFISLNEVREIVNGKRLYATSDLLQERLAHKNNGKTTIMIVDDDIDTLTLTGRIELAGFKVHAFVDALIGSQQVQKDCKCCQPPISDIRMPALTDFQLVRRVRMCNLK